MLPGAHGTFIDSSDPRWLAVLDRARHDIYHTPAYVEAEAQRLGGSAIAYLVDDDERLLFLPLLLRWVGDVDGLRTAAQRICDAVSPYGYPGLVVSPSALATPGFIDHCLDGLVAALRTNGVCSAFIRLHPLLNGDLDRYVNRHTLTRSGLTVSVDLKLSEERLWATMRRGHTNAINKARRAGYRTEIGFPRERFADFAGVYAETMERLRASSGYVFNLSYLQRLTELDEAHVAVALLGDEVAGAYLFFERNGIVQMHLGGTRSQYMRPSPSNLLIHAIALWSKERGNESLHLGGGLGGSATDSLFTFKSGFSPVRHPYFTLRIVADPEQYDSLVARRAAALGVPASELMASAYFPAYRATLPDDGVSVPAPEA